MEPGAPRQSGQLKRNAMKSIQMKLKNEIELNWLSGMERRVGLARPLHQIDSINLYCGVIGYRFASLALSLLSPSTHPLINLYN